VSNRSSSLPSLLRLTLERDVALSYTASKAPAESPPSAPEADPAPSDTASKVPVAVAGKAPARGYASPWPDALPALGPRTIGPFDLCSTCTAWSWVRYGGVVLCLACATARSHHGEGTRP
jgi:hypothetical protein